MMLTIHGLPPHVKFQELKALVRQECNITDFILDNLVIDDDGCKKVRIGVTDDSDGSHLMKCLNGFRLTGHVLRVVPVGKPGPPNQEYDSRGYQHRNEFSTQANSYGNRLLDNQLGRGSSWTPNAQWSPNQPPLLQPQPNTFNQSQSGPLNTPFPAMPQARGQFAPGRGPHQSQGFGYPPKNNLQDHPVILGKDQFQGSNQYNVGHTPAFQGQDQIFQGAHGQPVQWNMQKQPLFDKQTPGYNQGGYKDQIPIKPGMEPMRKGLNDYKDQDRSDRYMSSRPMSPGRRVSPRGRLSPSGRRMSPSGRRISPHSAGPHGRIMTPHGFHDRRMSPSGRKDSPRVDLGPPGRGASPGRRLSPSGPQGRRMSPESFRHRVEPESILPGRRISPSGVPGRRMSPGFAGKRVSPPRRMSPSERRIPSRHSPGRRGSPRRMSPAKRASPGRRGSPRGSRDHPRSHRKRHKSEDRNDIVESRLPRSSHRINDRKEHPATKIYERHSDNVIVDECEPRKRQKQPGYEETKRVEMDQPLWHDIPEDSLSGHGEASEYICYSRVMIRDTEIISKQQLPLFRNAILSNIIQIKRRGSGPKFLGYMLQDGVIIVQCKDRLSHNWLLGVVPKLSPWPDAKFTFTPELDTSDLICVTTCLPMSEDDSLNNALQMFRLQNRCLNTEKWDIMNVKNTRHGQLMTVFIDQPSLESIKENGYKASFGLGFVCFQVLSD